MKVEKSFRFLFFFFATYSRRTRNNIIRTSLTRILYPTPRCYFYNSVEVNKKNSLKKNIYIYFYRFVGVRKYSNSLGMI